MDNRDTKIKTLKEELRTKQSWFNNSEKENNELWLQLLSLQTADEENGIRENAMSSIPSLKNFKATHYKHSMENTLVKCTAAACAQTEMSVCAQSKHACNEPLQ